jgi:hypothetical protein
MPTCGSWDGTRSSWRCGSPTWPGSARASLFDEAGLERTHVTTLTVRVRYASFAQWWEPLTLGVGPAGSYLASLAPDRRTALREECRRLLPASPVEISATAWAVVGGRG